MLKKKLGQECGIARCFFRDYQRESLMLTPLFECSQSPECIFLAIKLPYAKINEVDFRTDGCDFSFFNKPYLLQLTFPGKDTLEATS